MIVLDASVVTDGLLDVGGRGEWARSVIGGREYAHAPEILDVEVVSAVRRQLRSGRLSVARATAAVEDLAQLRVTRWPHRMLMPRIWALRDAVSAHDAAYVSLAEILGARLVTGDRRLAEAAHDARVEVYPG